ncbi:MAG: NUDIX domain-containing protein, partial [Proteobacteria bacterium]|nr:NUDIX domain-containing protein [Pseudomonadota bacterium]
MPNSQKAYPSVYGVIIKDNKVLLMKRQNTCFRNGFYSFPGGRVDNLEHPSLAVIREMKEEVNLSINKNDISLMLAQHRISDGYACMDFFFLINNFNEDEIKINEP